MGDRIRLLLARRLSLRTKIITWSIVPTAIVLAIVAWASFYAYQRLTEDLVIERDREMTELIASELAREVNENADLLMFLSQPMKDSVTGIFAIRQIGSIVRPRVGRGGRAYLVDGGGRIIYDSETVETGKDVSQQRAVQRVLNGRTGAIRTRDVNGREIVASFAPVPGTNWGLITEESWGDLIRSSQGYRQLLLLLLALGAIAPVLAITVGVRRITQPIAELISAANRLAGGRFDQIITVNTGDELEELAGQFNHMAAELQASYSDLERKVADRTKELATLNAIAASMNESLDLDQTLNRALDELLELLDLEVGEIRLLDQERNELVIRTQRGLSEEFIRRTDACSIVETVPGQVLSTGQPVVYEDIANHPDNTWAIDEGLRAVAIFPLQVKEKHLGTLCLATRRGPRAFDKDERELLHAVGDQVGVAVEKARMFETEQRRAEQFQLISEVGQRIASILAVDKLLEEIVHLVRETLGYYLVSIGLIEEDEVVIAAGAGQLWETPDFEPLHLKVAEDGIVGWVAQHGEPLMIPDVTQEPRYQLIPRNSQTCSELAVPIKTKDTIIGVLDVQSDYPKAFDEKDLTVLQSLAHQAAIAIENARLYQQAQQLAVMQERTRLARDLHDSVTQSLYGVTLFAEAAGRLLSVGDTKLASENLRELQDTAQEALREMRLLIFELRPPILGEIGLAAALQARLEAVEGRAGLETTFHSKGDSLQLLPEVEDSLYRIAQETLNNVLKHANARHVGVYLRQNRQQIVLEITDDGVGFNPEMARLQGGLGLQGMEERAAEMRASLSIESNPGAGTRVRVEVFQ